MKYLRRLSQWFLDKFFYSYMIKLLEEEFDIVIQAYENDKKIAESKMKRLPQIGYTIEFLNKMELMPFKVESISLSNNGCICKCCGHRIKENDQ